MEIERESGIFESLVMVVVSFGATFFQAFVLFKIWGWFAVPLGVVSVPVAAFVGLTCMLTILSFRPPKGKTPRKSANEQWSLLLAIFMLNTLALFSSWLALVLL